MVAEEVMMEPTGMQQDSGLKKAMYITVMIFLGGLFVMGAFAAYTVVSSVNKANEAMAPVGDLVKSLFTPVEPIILPDPVTLLRQINDEARLMTVSADYEQIVTSERNTDLLWGLAGETMIFQGVGKVTGGLDLNQLTAVDIQVVDPTTVRIHLPPSIIFDDLPVLDTERSQVLDRDTGFLTQADPQLETQLRQAAQEQILAAAYESDLLSRADYNAQLQITALMQGAGFETVIFEDDPLPPATPYVQELHKGEVLVTPAP